MDTHGHQKVADEVGEPILRQALGQDIRLESFYLGNWLTDVSQLIDPVVVDGFIKDLDKNIDEIARSVFQLVRPDKFRRLIENALKDRIDKAKEELKDALKDFIGKKNDTRGSKLQDCIRLVIRISGYFKFCHPEEGNGNFRLNPEIFFRIFDDRYTQYYPHEHCDRPEFLGSDPKRFAAEKEQGSATSSKLYKYLKEDLLVISGLLAEVDASFSKFASGVIKVSDTELHQTLAKLGHALHAMEDFFAHSNFVETAFTCMEPKFLEDNGVTARSGNSKIDAIFNSIGVIFEKRLKGLKDGKMPTAEEMKKWRDMLEETHIVTGYFDSWDTFFSLSAVLLEAFDLDKEDPADLYYKGKNYIKSRKLLTDTLEVITDYDKSVKDKENKIAQASEERIKDFKKKYKSKSAADRKQVNDEIIDLMFAQDELFKNANYIKNDVRALIRLLAEPPKSLLFVKDGYTYYKLIKNVTKFFRSPQTWLLEQIKDLLGDKFKDVFVFYTEELAYNLLDKYRIGSHSLLAKDHHNDRFHVPMFNCCGAIHFYIVDNLTRWFKPYWQKDSRKDKPVWINWQELVEYFLRHPKANFDDGDYEEEMFVYTFTHIVRNDSNNSDTLASLADQYRRESYYGVANDAAALEQSYPYWKAIADANWGITEKLDKLNIVDVQKKDQIFKQLINQILRSTNTGDEITQGWAKGNFALKNNTPVLIPYLIKKRKRKKVKDLKEKWFYDVLNTNSWKIFQKENEHNLQGQYFKNKYHTIKGFEGTNKIGQLPTAMSNLILNAAVTRLDLEKKYGPARDKKK